MSTATGESRSAQRGPHPALAGLLDAYHGYRISATPSGVHHGLPGRALTLVIAFDDPIEVRWLGRDDTGGRFRVIVSGLHSGPAVITQGGPQAGIQLGLTPAGARILLGVPAAALAGSLVGLDEVVGGLERRLYDAVAGVEGWSRRFDALDAELLRLRARYADASAPTRPELVEAWRWLGRHVGAGTVTALADEVGWSRRHLTEQFRAEYGLGPKEVARIARFERSHALLRRTDAPPLADVAAECGYADQAHLTREWRDLAGYTPAQWRREELPNVQDLAPVD